MQFESIAAIVTGGASGLGAATARLLARGGAKVSLFDLNQDLGSALAAEIGGRFEKVDVTSETEVIAAIAAAEAAYGIARILVNCAGIGAPAKTILRDGSPQPIVKFRRIIEVNLIGSYNVASKFAARLATAEPIGEERGVIVNTASVAAFDGQVGQCAYSASKAGIAGMTLPLARDLASHLIRVNTIAPGVFMTPILEALTPEALASLASQVPMPARLGRPEEYAELAGQLISNAYVNGETIRIDGSIRMAPR
ncbi:SDR family oxidoreductase [Sphingomonadaceae bacterium G21617-S1]|jgi:NAD(P)-dependent dehydrogenase (short-subunit alcohol dehydrogenase family)|uniref:SDR family NAD(P)-dependent oxidoreductase n=1 Tax=Rhizorhabdus sp. TaxID=1968843 RepID=UPI00199F2B9E|nr:SDR family NAD(P)-dependent oxidoreductase [Rhizorhabdus sp.]MBD3759226.1 SDR family oxidoreductase [Rhizorhabdus sp.]MCZ4341999.1 SDR family oxidoreductase [Sphingomonadaceae bacterium G21617-S1]